MGIEYHALNLLLLARRQGVSYERTCMIGRQGLHMTPRILQTVLRRHGLPAPPATLGAIYRDGFAERLFTDVLGARVAHSIDASAYEGATHVADLNAAFVPETRYSAVIDCGTLEHCFNVPQAFTNVIDLCETGGHIVHVLPSNNYCGHGFYQFSPELFFSMYDSSRGFDLLGVYLAEEGVSTRWWSVQSPMERKARVTLRNSVETHILVVARKRADAVTPLQCAPYQSDYEQLSWRGAAAGHFKAEQIMGNRWFKDRLHIYGLFGMARAAKRVVASLTGAGSPARMGFRRMRPGGA